MTLISLKEYISRWLHPRKLLIVSDQQVRQLHIGVGVQLCALMLLASGVAWSSYATGRFIAARGVVSQQNMALQAIANENPFGMFSSLAPQLALTKPTVQKTDPLGFSALSSLKGDAMLMQVATLEQQVRDLKLANDLIVSRVREKTGGQIEQLESIIADTGLDPDALKRQAKRAAAKDKKAEGGPYIPPHLNTSEAMPKETTHLFSELDDLSMLRNIIGSLPLAKPMKNADMQSVFGHRVDPFNGRLAFHSGMDMAAPAGAAVLSAGNGVVVDAGRDGAYGNKIDIDHGNGVISRYGHLNRINVRKGEFVTTGQAIGIQGSTGRSTGPHLHYEVRYFDKPINPQRFIEAGRDISQN
jgi:murein DD-endopeptidase MepM/ murein hydrolase activator NlpD